MPISDEQRARTLERFERHRRAWDENAALRALYADWYGRIAQALPTVALGRRVEIGSGPGFARHFIPDLELSDIVRAPWHDREVSADALPFADASLGAIVLFDVLHHLPEPGRFFAEAIRTLRAGGRVILCEPYVSPVSYPVYRFLHEEPLDMRADPLAPHEGTEPRDPFDANQAVPTLLFDRRRARERFRVAHPGLALTRVEHFAGLSYPASGGFSRRPLLPGRIWSWLRGVEDKLPSRARRWSAFRMLVTLERR